MTAPDRYEQWKKVESAQKTKLNNICHMISVKWWNKFISYIKSESDTHPGVITNSDILDIEAGFSYGENYCDWTHAKLKDGLEENKDYILINQVLWLQLHAWYHGGPVIHIFIVGKTPTHPSCRIGFPDTKPIKLQMYMQVTGSKPRTYMGYFSLKMTGRQLYGFINENYNYCADSLEINSIDSKKSISNKIPDNNTTLEENGVTNECFLSFSEKSINLKDFLTQSTSESKAPTYSKPKKAETGCTTNFDENDIDRAIAESLQDQETQNQKPKSENFKSEKYNSLIELLKTKTDLKIQEEYKRFSDIEESLKKYPKVKIEMKKLPQIFAEISRVEENAVSLLKMTEKDISHSK